MTIKNMLKTTAALLLCLCVCLKFAACGSAADWQDADKTQPAQTQSGQAAETQPDEAPPTENQTHEEDEMNNEKVLAYIEVEGYGVIELELYPDIAPQSVYNFCSLARSGFYDGVIFHRVINGFMIQGGDPTGTGNGGPGYCIKGEFAVNGVENSIKHERGVISIARAKGYDTAGSQFFICQSTAGVAHLDGQYAAFGRVLSGMNIVDAIAAVQTNSNNRPLTNVVIKSVTITGPELPEPEKLPGR